MQKLARMILATVIALAFFSEAQAKMGDRGTNAGFCKSGKQTRDLKLCKENGGKR